MAARVMIVTAGDHSFDLAHFKREGAEDLVKQLLANAGFVDPGVLWKLQIDKKLVCGGLTKPVSVVREFKPWGIYLRLKPGDNNSCHQCTLFVPEGQLITGKDLHDRLKLVESIPINWKHLAKKRAKDEEEVVVETPTAATNGRHANIGGVAVAEPPHVVTATPVEDALRAVDQVVSGISLPDDDDGPKDDKPKKEDRRSNRFNTAGYIDANLQKLMLVVRTLSAKRHQNAEAYLVALRREVSDLSDLNLNQMGNLVSKMLEKDLISKVTSGATVIGYNLTKKGEEAISEVIQREKLGEKSKQTGHRAQIIISAGSLAERLVAASKRLSLIDTERGELKGKLTVLDREEAELTAFVGDPDVQLLLQKLTEKMKK